MKKQKLKNYLKFGIFLFGISFTFFACVKDDAILETESSQKPTFNITIDPYSHFKSQNKKLALKIDKLVKNESLKRSETSQEYGFTINDNNVQVMQRDDFTTYTFLVFRDNPEPNILENYVYKEANDGTYEQFVLKYAYSVDENESRIYDTTFLEIQTINDGNLLLNRSGCVPEFVEVLDGISCTYNTRCTGSGRHEVGDSSCQCTPSQSTCDPAGSTVCDLDYVYVYQGCGGGATDDNNDNTNNDTNTTGGNTTGNTNNDNTSIEEEIQAIPFDDELGLIRECKKAKRFLDNNPNFKTLLLGLNNDLNLDYEKSIMKFENVNNIIVDQGTPDQAKVRLLTLQGHIYKAYAHTHYETSTTPNGDTFSVFSLEDIVGTASILSQNLADTNNFVMYLSTGKGTYYAMTINNKARFLKFFNYALNKSNPPSSLEEFNKWVDSKDKYIELRNKYFNSENAIIKETNNNNNEVLEAFLQFMDEANMGTTLLKTDENFNEFTRVTYKPNLAGINIEEKPCNN